MSDVRLRTLERAAATGDQSARVAWLRERVRCGDLSRERLTDAAVFGDRAARMALGFSADSASDAETIHSWLTAILDSKSREAKVTAQIAAAEVILPVWRQRYDVHSCYEGHDCPPLDQRQEAVIKAARAWLTATHTACSCDDLEAEWIKAESWLFRTVPADLTVPTDHRARSSAPWLPLATDTTPPPSRHWRTQIIACKYMLAPSYGPSPTPNDLRRAISQALVAWALAQSK